MRCGNVHGNPHTAVHQRLNALVDIAVRFRAPEDLVAEHQRVIDLVRIGTRIDRVHHIWLYDNDIPCRRDKLFVSAVEFGKSLPDEVDLEFAVPVHGRIGKFVRDHTLIIAERLDL